MQYTLDQGVRSPLQANLSHTRNFAVNHNWLPTLVSAMMLLWIGLIFTNIHLSTTKTNANPSASGNSINHGAPISYHTRTSGDMAVTPVNSPPMDTRVVVVKTKLMTTSKAKTVATSVAAPTTTNNPPSSSTVINSGSSSTPTSSDPADCNCGNGITGTSSAPVTSGDGDNGSSTGNEPAPTNGNSGDDGTTGTTITTPITPPISIDPLLPPVSVPPVSVTTPVVSVGL